MMRAFLIALSILALHSTTTFAADPETDAMQASIDARDSFVTALENKEYTEVTRQGFDVAIHELAQTIRDEQHDDVLADQLLAQWGHASLDFAAKIQRVTTSRDLGDHAPLFPWLQAFIKQLADKYGTIIYSLPIVKDITTLNFAIPVVFSPRGNWQVQGANTYDANRIEYRKHFIPFANIVTYYVVLYGCKYLLAREGMSQMKQICPKAATKLQFLMGRYVAPPVSDWIFQQGNRAIQISSQQLGYTNAEDLRHAIQH